VPQSRISLLQRRASQDADHLPLVAVQIISFPAPPSGGVRRLQRARSRLPRLRTYARTPRSDSRRDLGRSVTGKGVSAGQPSSGRTSARRRALSVISSRGPRTGRRPTATKHSPAERRFRSLLIHRSREASSQLLGRGLELRGQRLQSGCISARLGYFPASLFASGRVWREVIQARSRPPARHAVRG
jgi:hypothetical protein